MLSLFGARLLSESFWDAKVGFKWESPARSGTQSLGCPRAMAAAASSAQSCARREGQGPRAVALFGYGSILTLAGSADEP